MIIYCCKQREKAMGTGILVDYLIQLKYCPFCGTRLETTIGVGWNREHLPKYLARMAKKKWWEFWK